MDVEGARVYLDEKTPELRKRLFESLVERDSKTYRYQGSFANPTFVEVEEGTEGGFWSGKVITEYDLNLSMRFYYMAPDASDVFDSIVAFGSICVMAMLATEVTVVVAANLEAIRYYCQNWGIKEGLDMYRVLGTQYVPNGILSQIQYYEGSGSNSLIEISFDNKQLGQKWGEHMKDYPNLNSYQDYKNLANNIFINPNRIIFDAANSEYYYLKGNDLLRLSTSGDFISLYPGATSDRVINAINALIPYR